MKVFKLKHRWSLLISCSLLTSALVGCVGVAGPGYVGVDTYVPAPDVYVFGGYGRGHFDHDAGRRGFESRRAIGHAGGGHFGGGHHR